MRNKDRPEKSFAKASPQVAAEWRTFREPDFCNNIINNKRT